ncbi:3-isopropylmalate dehydratase small subunit [Bradyrhizobium diazoefficiens]|uniref:3-isopropylmalate dehydratase small subunit n=1 Tax=Bradyrhizobium diazoefficiens TaxID=1355477 RepID=UPI0019093611|nr:3-isopropylmalate dehydratase small subunit [Bradyrhizobium diazoefficiens]MBK3664931.1 3-isopropylmalate dehydratase small subunit [Bradyrhizobium diazoefficiens]
MKPFRVLSATAAPLLSDNIDTDVIIRIEKLVGMTDHSELGRWCFGALRYLPDGSENPEFVLNQSPYRGSEILLAGANFGCGSSREGAVWAMMQIGLKAVLAPSFGEIFYNNCFQNGVLPVALARSAIEEIASELEPDAGRAVVTVDLERQRVVSPRGKEHAFEIPGLRREALLEGLDDIGITLKREAVIAAHQERDRMRRPWVYEIAEVRS